VSRRSRRNKVEAEDRAEIDLTPMLDVVFIMLIFFIVTASFLKENSLSVNVPDQSEEQQTQQSELKNVLIEVNASNEIYIDKRRVDQRAVRSLIAQKRAENPAASVIVRMHEKSKAERYVQIADAAREARIYNVALVPYNDD
jgi:biopolymer transport protein ExbD